MLKCKKEKNRQNVGFIFCVAKTLATESGKGSNTCPVLLSVKPQLD